jgi:hypothetical protein
MKTRISYDIYNYFNLTRWVYLNDLIYNIINWSIKDKFIDILNKVNAIILSKTFV